MKATNRLLAYLRITLAPLRSERVVVHPETAALHARLDSTEERLDLVLNRLKRGLASRSERSHLQMVQKGE